MTDISGKAAARHIIEPESDESRVEQIGVMSVEVAGRLLKTLASFDGPQTLSALSAAANMPPAKAHRYLVSLIREGFVEQSATDGRYDFGGSARHIGRVAINRLDIMRIGAPLLRELRDEVRETVSMGTWTPQGPMVIEWFDMIRPVSVVVRPGSILPMLTSAMGLVFSSYLPLSVVQPLIDEQATANLNASKGERATTPLQVRLDKVRSNGFSLVQGDLVKGLDSLAVPVLDHRGDLVASIAVVGASGSLDIRPTGRIVRDLKLKSQRFSDLLR